MSEKNKLFGSLTYETETEYLEFLKNIDSAQGVAMLVAAAAYAQGCGVFSLKESEVVMTSIRKLIPQEQLDAVIEIKK